MDTKEFLAAWSASQPFISFILLNFKSNIVKNNLGQ